MPTSFTKKITHKAVDDLQPDQIVWDTDVKGFAVRCQKQSKSYVVKYRFQGRQRWYTIGRCGSGWTPANARKEAIRLLSESNAGRDPAETKNSYKTIPTFADVADRFLEEHAVHLADNTSREYRRLFEKTILPQFKNVRITNVSQKDILDLHYKLRSRPIIANRVVAILSKMFNLAEAWGYRPNHSNPCNHVKKYSERHRERMLTPEELARLGQALQDFEGSPYAVAALRLLIFTGARLNEILGLRWDQINFEQGQARLSVHKTSRTAGAKTLHLPTPAIELLQDLPRVDGNPYVIVGHRDGAHLVNLQKPWRQIRALADLDDVRIHDLRHCFASVGVSSGLSLPIVGKLLGHNQSQTTQRYAHLSPSPLKDAAESVALSIQNNLTGDNKKRPLNGE